MYVLNSKITFRYREETKIGVLVDIDEKTLLVQVLERSGKVTYRITRKDVIAVL